MAAIAIFTAGFTLALVKHIFRKSEDSLNAAVGWAFALIYAAMYFATRP